MCLSTISVIIRPTELTDFTWVSCMVVFRWRIWFNNTWLYYWESSHAYCFQFWPSFCSDFVSFVDQTGKEQLCSVTGCSSGRTLEVTMSSRLLEEWWTDIMKRSTVSLLFSYMGRKGKHAFCSFKVCRAELGKCILYFHILSLNIPVSVLSFKYDLLFSCLLKHFDSLFYYNERIVYYVFQIKRGQLLFLLVTNECIYKI